MRRLQDRTSARGKSTMTAFLVSVTSAEAGVPPRISAIGMPASAGMTIKSIIERSGTAVLDRRSRTAFVVQRLERIKNSKSCQTTKLRRRHNQTMKNQGFLAVLASVLFAAAMSFTAYGAEIRSLETAMLGDGPTFQVTLSGEIKAGDAKAISGLLDDLGYGKAKADGSAKTDVSRAVIKFDSPGGNFSEGLKIAKLLSDRNVQTIVPAGSKCFSACAIAFLGGTTLGYEDAKITSRAVTIGGILGFHAPYLDVPSASYDKKTVDLAYQAAVYSIADLIRLARTVGLSTDLLPEVLYVGRDQIETLGTVDDFGRFRIAINPVPTVEKMTRSMITNACQNGYEWNDPAVRDKTESSLTKALHDDFSSFRFKTGYFSGGQIPAVRSVVAVAVGGEGITTWCLFDHALVDGRIKMACRGYIGAYDLNEAVQRARKFDKNGEYGTPEVDCNLTLAVDATIGIENINTDVFALVPPTTSISDVANVISRMSASEKPLIP
jgi:hypothetical protein